MLKTVTALCCNSRTAYRFLPGVEYFDQARDARNFQGGTPVVAHPPCAPWSRHCRHQSKFTDELKALGPFCVGQVQRNGGVLEHPAGSLLFAECSLPTPGESDFNGWTVEVWQAWWGYPMRKATWLYFVGVPRRAVTFPLSLHAPGGDRRREQLMSHRERSLTTMDFARWLVDQARLSTIH